MAGTCSKVVIVLVVALVLVASASAAAPNVAAMNLQPADMPGAKVSSQGSVKEKGYVAAYGRSFAFAAPYGKSKLIAVEVETQLAASVATATADIGALERLFRSKAGHAALVAQIARSAKVQPKAVVVGALRKVAGYDQGFELPVSVTVKGIRAYENISYLRLDRVVVTLAETGLRGIAAADTSHFATIVAGHIGTELAPIGVSLPTVAGTAQQGQTLSGSPGTWTAPDAVLTYQWQRCDAAGATCVDVAGAATQTYAVAAADVGTTLHVVVTAANRFGVATATSTQTAVVV